MPQYVLVGGPFEIYDTPLQGQQHDFNCVLGAVFELDEKLAVKTIKNGAALLPKDHYERLDITPEEEKAYPNALRQKAAPEAFHSKMLAARIAVEDYRAELAQEK